MLTRDVILDRVWGYTFDSGTNSLAVYVGYLRRKTEADGESRYLHTVRGVGYVLRESRPSGRGWWPWRPSWSFSPSWPPARPATSPPGLVDQLARRNAADTATSILSHGGRVTDNSVKGLGVQYTAPSGQVLSSGSNLPVTAKVKAVAAGKASSYFTEITLHGDDYREFVENAGTVNVTNEVGIILYTSPAALQVALPLDSVDRQLSHLGVILIIVAIAGIGLAFVLAWLVSRTALVPLDELTAAVEEVAETTDTSRRLDAGGADELGRLRRAFNHLLAALDRSQEAQRQLVLDAGHELRTPLTSLRTNLEVVRRLDELRPRTAPSSSTTS